MHMPAPVPTTPRKWVRWVTNLTASNKGCRQPGQKNMKHFVKFFCRAQKWFCLRSQHWIFCHNSVRTLFHSVARDFFRTLFTMFLDIFRTIFHTIFRTAFQAELLRRSVLHISSNTVLQSCALPKGVSIVCSLSTAQLSPRQAIPLLVDQARHSWPNTRTNKSFRRHVFGKTSANFHSAGNPTITITPLRSRE